MNRSDTGQLVMWTIYDHPMPWTQHALLAPDDMHPHEDDEKPMLYKVIIDAVDGETWYVAGGPDKAVLLAFLNQHDHEGSSLRLEWMSSGGALDTTDDAERVYRILRGDEP